MQIEMPARASNVFMGALIAFNEAIVKRVTRQASMILRPRNDFRQKFTNWARICRNLFPCALPDDELRRQNEQRPG